MHDTLYSYMCTGYSEGIVLTTPLLAKILTPSLSPQMTDPPNVGLRDKNVSLLAGLYFHIYNMKNDHFKYFAHYIQHLKKLTLRVFYPYPIPS